MFHRYTCDRCDELCIYTDRADNLHMRTFLKTFKVRDTVDMTPSQHQWFGVHTDNNVTAGINLEEPKYSQYTLAVSCLEDI